MSAPTPDRAALAERMEAWAANVGADCPRCDPPRTPLCDECKESQATLLQAAAALAAPALPPSVAEARDEVLDEMHAIAMEVDGGDDQGPTTHEVARRVVSRVDALIAAVRAEADAPPDARGLP